jgi:putative transposase
MDPHANTTTAEARRRRLPHALPPWVCTDHCYLLTLCTLPRHRNQLCRPTVAAEVHDSLETYQALGRWQLHVLVLMPDHLHLLATIPPTTAIQRTVVNWKRFICRRHDVRWQQDFFEHRLRVGEHFDAKRECLRLNPARAGLVTDPDEWPFLYEW